MRERMSPVVSGSVHPVLRFLRKLTADDPSGEPSDGQLLARFVGRRDEAAFAALVCRHGPMVLGVCQRVLRDPHDADDAFQATFLVLTRRAHSIGRPERLGNWLYGVAYRTALKARAGAARRRAELRPVPEVAVADAAEEVAWRDLRPVLDEELSRLPEKYRTAVVLCDLEGRTHEEAARRLGCPRETVTTRLARARARLRGRLARRGLALSGALLATLLSREAATAALPAGLAEGTIGAALRFAAGKAAVGAIPTSVTALAEGVLTTMFWTQLTKVAAVLMAVALLGGGTGVVAYRALAGQQERPSKKEAAGKGAPAKPGDPVAEDRDKLKGTWQAVSGEGDGKPLADDFVKNYKAVFRGDRVKLSASDDQGEGTFTLDPRKTPKAMDITISEKEKALGIYEVKGDALKLCMVEDKDGNERPTEFAGKNKAILIVFRRVPEAGKPAPPKP